MRQITDKLRAASLIFPAVLLALFAALAPQAHADGCHECCGRVFETPLSGEIPHELAPGSYYLTDDCFLSRHANVSGEVSICLNGHSVEVEGMTTFHALDGGVLNIYDHTGEGVIGYVGGTLNNHPAILDAGGTLNLYGGRLYAKTNSVAINNEGTVNIYGGVVESATDGYCAVKNKGVLNICGGTLIGGDAVWQRWGGTVTLGSGSFVLRAGDEVLRYIRDEGTTFAVTAPLYMWRTAEDGEFVSSEEQPFEPCEGTEYLEFAPLRVRVTLDYGGGSGSELTEHLCGEVTPLPTDAVKEGCVFAGWRGADGELVLEISADARGAQSFEATWTELPKPTEEAAAPIAEEAEAPTELPTEEAADDVPEAGARKNAAPVFIAVAAALCCAAAAVLGKKK